MSGEIDLQENLKAKIDQLNTTLQLKGFDDLLVYDDDLNKLSNLALSWFDENNQKLKHYEINAQFFALLCELDGLPNQSVSLPLELGKKLLTINESSSCTSVFTSSVESSVVPMGRNLSAQQRADVENLKLNRSAMEGFVGLMMRIFYPIDSECVREMILRYAFDNYKSDVWNEVAIQDDIQLVVDMLVGKKVVTNQLDRNWLYGLLGICHYSSFGVSLDSASLCFYAVLRELTDGVFDRNHLKDKSKRVALKELLSEIIDYARKRLDQTKVDVGDSNVSSPDRNEFPKEEQPTCSLVGTSHNLYQQRAPSVESNNVLLGNNK